MFFSVAAAVLYSTQSDHLLSLVIWFRDEDDCYFEYHFKSKTELRLDQTQIKNHQMCRRHAGLLIILLRCLIARHSRKRENAVRCPWLDILGSIGHGGTEPNVISKLRKIFSNYDNLQLQREMHLGFLGGTRSSQPKWSFNHTVHSGKVKTCNKLSGGQSILHFQGEKERTFKSVGFVCSRGFFQWF